MKNKIIVCLCMLMLSSYLTGCKIGDTEYVLDTNIATGREVFSVNEAECSQKEARVYLGNYRNLYGKEYGVDLWNYEFEGEPLEDYIRNSTLEELTRIVCMNIVAEQKELELSEDEKKAAQSAAKDYFASLTDSDKAYLGVSVSELTEIYQRYAIAEKLYNQLTDGVNEEVSDDEARVMRVQQLIVSDKTIADEAISHLKAGEDFATVANIYSETPVVETNISRDDYPKDVENIVFNLDDNQVSELIETAEGYYCIKCINKFDQELTEANKANILIKREKDKFNDVYGDFVKNAQFELNEAVWNTMTVGEHKDVTTASFFEFYDKNF